MLVRNLAVRTIDTYTYHVDRFARHFGKLPEDLGPERDLRGQDSMMGQTKGEADPMEWENLAAHEQYTKFKRQLAKACQRRMLPMRRGNARV
jgi:hypothetical protein